MVITIELPPEVEIRLRQGAERGDREEVRRLLAESLAPQVEAILLAAPRLLTDSEFEAMADELAEGIALARGPNAQPLSGFAMSRESFYEGRP